MSAPKLTAAPLEIGEDRYVRGPATPVHPGRILGKVYRTKGGFYRAWRIAGDGWGPFESEDHAERWVRGNLSNAEFRAGFERLNAGRAALAALAAHESEGAK